MNKSDYELLELVAKCINLEVISVQHGKINATADGNKNFHWNPLTEDGDALRLAIKLKMTVSIDDCGYTVCEASVFDAGIFVSSSEYHEQSNPENATRRAIVHAAAKIAIAKGIK